MILDRIGKGRGKDKQKRKSRRKQIGLGLAAGTGVVGTAGTVGRYGKAALDQRKAKKNLRTPYVGQSKDLGGAKALLEDDLGRLNRTQMGVRSALAGAARPVTDRIPPLSAGKKQRLMAAQSAVSGGLSSASRKIGGTAQSLVSSGTELTGRLGKGLSTRRGKGLAAAGLVAATGAGAGVYNLLRNRSKQRKNRR